MRPLTGYTWFNESILEHSQTLHLWLALSLSPNCSLVDEKDVLHSQIKKTPDQVDLPEIMLNARIKHNFE